jgi:hypothetical protein
MSSLLEVNATDGTVKLDCTVRSDWDVPREEIIRSKLKPHDEISATEWKGKYNYI